MPLTTLPLQDHIQEQTSISISYATLSAKFGDGYEQIADNGINNKQATWAVQYYTLNETDFATVSNFIDSVRGTLPFYATPRGEAQQLWRLDPASVRYTTVAVQNKTQKVYRTVSFNLKKAYV